MVKRVFEYGFSGWILCLFFAWLMGAIQQVFCRFTSRKANVRKLYETMFKEKCRAVFFFSAAKLKQAFYRAAEFDFGIAIHCLKLNLSLEKTAS